MGNSVTAEGKPLTEEFPLTVACVDAGSNGIRFAAARFRTERHFEILATERIPVRLGHEVFLTGRLSHQTMDQAVEGFCNFRRKIDELHIHRWRACATSAVREASNSKEFKDRVFAASGIEIQIIDGAEEAWLVHLAVSNRIDLGDRPWLMVDLGGGSVEISLSDSKGIHWFESYTIGSVRLLEQLTQSGESPEQFLSLLEEYVSTIRVPLSTEDKLAGYIATGGNIEELVRLAPSSASSPPDGVARLSMSDLRGIISRLAVTTYKQRVEQFGLRPDRADVILPAAMVYERLGKLAGVTEITVPRVGVRDGILLDIVADACYHGDDRRLDSQIEDAALTLGRKYRFDEAHATHVAKMALSIFDQMIDVHGWGRAERRILHAAALLHEIGMFVNRASHHKHSLYLIENSSLVGFLPNEVRMAANVARYHRKSPPKTSHLSFQSLSRQERQIVLSLSAILRVADSLDHGHKQRVQKVTVIVERARVRLVVESEGNLIFGSWSLRNKSDMFRDVFSRKVVLQSADQPTPDLDSA
ncbi:Ppx/GppA family phosphatase [bacterium]|nr:Ppx/GppA family phosphatase [bacterium]